MVAMLYGVPSSMSFPWCTIPVPHFRPVGCIDLERCDVTDICDRCGHVMLSDVLLSGWLQIVSTWIQGWSQMTHKRYWSAWNNRGQDDWPHRKAIALFYGCTESCWYWYKNLGLILLDPDLSLLCLSCFSKTLHLFACSQCQPSYTVW